MRWDFFPWIFINLMVSLGLVFLATYPPLFGPAVRNLRTRFWRHVAAASVMAIFCMLFPWQAGPKQLIDLRMVPLGITGMIYGLPGAALVGGVIMVVRTWIGGPGVITTVFYTLGCLALVPLFKGRPRNWRVLALLGAAQTLVGYSVGQTLVQPAPPGLEYNSPLWLSIGLAQIVGMWMVSGAIDHVLERQRLQDTLTEALRSREAVLALIPHGILFLDEQGAVTDSNQAARALLEGNHLLPLILGHPDVERALQLKMRISGCRVTLPARLGGERIVLVSALPLTSGGAVLGVENITTVVREEREEARRARLELLGRMAAMAAHEIRNPLTTIKGFLQLLVRKPEFAEHRGIFTLVQGETEHIGRVVADFLELSGATPPTITRVALDPLLDEVQEAMAIQFPNSAVTLSVSGEAGLSVMADERGLKQVLRNLVVNAFEAMPGGGMLSISRNSAGGMVQLVVADTGPGIDPEVMTHIFTPYTTTKSTGTGLGLAISHKLAIEMGAQLSVESEPGTGTIFRLGLPQASPLLEAAAASQTDA